MMVTPAGGRVEFRQTAASDTYETADGSYVQLKTTGASSPNDPVENVTIVITSTDGTRSSYEWKGGAYRCHKVTDRNGNYLTINHDDLGVLRTVTDTLGRVLAVNYDAGLYPTSITQTWKDDNGSGSDVAHTWASFTYGTKEISTSFSSTLSVVGPPNGTTLKVLEKVTYGDGSSTKFDYNGYAQVWKVSNVAADYSTHILNHVRTNLETPASNQTDCPRFTETKNFVENFNAGQETTVTNTIATGATYSLPGSLSGAATKIEVSMAGDPYNSVSKTFVGASGWNEGLPIATEDWADGANGSERKRWTWSSWTQDDENLTYILNPRTVENRVGDANNVKRTTTQYITYPLTQIAKYGLVSSTSIYDTDLSTELKRVETDYNLATGYLSRRIIGLPAETRAYGRETTGLNLVSKMTYAYDEGTFGDSSIGQNVSPVQHDNTNFGSSFVAGRGNVTSTTRHDVLGQTAAVTSTAKYNTAGAVVSQTDPMSRTVKIGYVDNFNTTGTPAGYAYPTSLTDPAGNSSTVKYRYDIGTNVEAVSPAPAGNSYGKKTKRVYDSLGRLQRDSVYMGSAEYAYTRFEYPTNGVQSKSFTTVVDAAGDGPDASDEVLSESWADGAGRVRRSRTEHPGSAGGYSGTLVEYDILGRVNRQSVPTEIDSSWDPAGDDYARGWLWTYQKYDWKGRVVRKINTDGADSPALNDSDVLISYEGCGCAGGQVTTIQGESVPRDDQPTSNARRTQKVYEDILGRSWKTVVYKWDGTTAYTTTEQSFNGRDQVVQTKQIDNTSTSSPQSHQEVTMTYDGHGRMKTRHYPVEDALTDTTWNYNADDSINQIVDPRGAITNFSYNSRGLTSQIYYNVPNNSTIPVAQAATFYYDGLGNRTLMTDGSGSHAYAYDPLSRLVSETQTFTELTATFTTGYSYQISGKLKSVTDAFGADMFYNEDRGGRTTSITGTDFLDVTTYASNIKFRAFGAVKELTMGSGDNSIVSYAFDNRLRMSNYQSTSSVISGGYVRKASYDYYADGGIKKVNNISDLRFDQNYTYDFAGRVKTSESGTATNNQQEQVLAYSQILAYDAFGNITQRNTGVWGSDGGFTANYTNGRKVQGLGEPTLTYDAAGNLTDRATSSTVYDRWRFDSAGRNTETIMRWYQGGPQQTSFDRTETVAQIHDGDGRSVKRIDTKVSTQVYPQNTTNSETIEYYLRSSVLGGKVMTELYGDGGKKLTKIYGGAGVLAEQRVFPADANHPQSSSDVFWRHEDLATGSHSSINRNGTVLSGDVSLSAEVEPLGGAIPQQDPVTTDELGVPSSLRQFRFAGDVERPEFGCSWDGTPLSCNLLTNILHVSGPHAHLKVNDRVEGGWGLYQSLRGAYTWVRHDSFADDTGNDPSGPDSKGVYHVDTATRQSSYWELLGSPFGSPGYPGGDDIERVKTDVQSARTKLTDKCASGLKDFLLGAVKKKFNLQDGSDELKYFADEILGLGAVLDKLSDANITSSAVHRSEQVTDAIYNNKVVASFTRVGESTTLDVGTKYFYGIDFNQMRSNNQSRYTLFSRSEKERVYTILHEAIHSVLKGFSDEFFAEYITNGKIKESDGDAHEKGSLKLTEKIKELCP
jgi:YD repeat-containing protein